MKIFKMQYVWECYNTTSLWLYQNDVINKIHVHVHIQVTLISYEWSNHLFEMCCHFTYFTCWSIDECICLYFVIWTNIDIHLCLLNRCIFNLMCVMLFAHLLSLWYICIYVQKTGRNKRDIVHFKLFYYCIWISSFKLLFYIIVIHVPAWFFSEFYYSLILLTLRTFSRKVMNLLQLICFWNVEKNFHLFVALFQAFIYIILIIICMVSTNCRCGFISRACVCFVNKLLCGLNILYSYHKQQRDEDWVCLRIISHNTATTLSPWQPPGMRAIRIYAPFSMLHSFSRLWLAWSTRLIWLKTHNIFDLTWRFSYCRMI